MKAITIPEYGGADVLCLRDVDSPKAGPEDLRIAVRATALNRADLLQRMGLYPQPEPKGEHEIPGLEFAGEVVEAGNHVTRFRVGDRVMGLLPGGGYAEEVVTHERLATAIPENLDFAEAAAVPEAFITAHDALTQCDFGSGDTVLVHAAGSGVGLAAIQIAKAGGARAVIGTAGSAEKLRRAAGYGLDVGINYRKEDFAERVRAATDGRGSDIIVDFIGGAYLASNLKALAEKGSIVVVGMLGGLSGELNLATLLAKRASIRGTMLRSRSLEEKAAATRAFEHAVLPHLASGAIRPVIDQRFALADAAEAHRRMEANENFGKIILEM
jgi:NADPH2:quinone reductase